MCYTNYLVTPKGHYFKIADGAMDALDFAGLRALEKAGCVFCLDLQDLYLTHIKTMKELMGSYEVEVEDLEGSEFFLQWNREAKEFVYFDDRGIKETFCDTLRIDRLDRLVDVLVEFEL